MNSKVLKILLPLFFINTLTFYLYFSSHPLPLPLPLTATHHTPTTFPSPFNSSAKPWPILPSYLPWAHTPPPPPHSCEAYFGHGFTTRVDVLTPSTQRKSMAPLGGWFRCWYSETLRSSVCEGGRVRMWPERIAMSPGGEKLDDVIGRSEGEEIPVFGEGAFEIVGRGGKGGGGGKLVGEGFVDQYRGDIERHTMMELFHSIRVVGEEDFQCIHRISITLFLVFSLMIRMGNLITNAFGF